MKKFTLTQVLLLATLTLIIGLFIGLFVDFPKTGTDDLAGTIGKASKYHNVKVTEDDILIRNELLEDTALRSQYERYLNYFYYQAAKTSSDLETVLKNTSGIEEFGNYTPVLKKASTFLETARIDILGALDVIQAIDSVDKIPVHAYLNDAGNAIARMSNQNSALLIYLDAIGNYLTEHPKLSTPALRDAHDILAINLMTYATVVNDKPTLRYLDKRKLTNDKERINQLIADESFQSTHVQRYINPDTEKYKLKAGYSDQVVLRGALCIDFPIIANLIVAGTVYLVDSYQMGNAEAMRTGYTDQSPLQGFLVTDQFAFGSSLLLGFNR
jgi:hypothetical protein